MEAMKAGSTGPLVQLRPPQSMIKTMKPAALIFPEVLWVIPQKRV